MSENKNIQFNCTKEQYIEARTKWWMQTFDKRFSTKLANDDWETLCDLVSIPLSNTIK
jgi:hypothetical protein